MTPALETPASTATIGDVRGIDVYDGNPIDTDYWAAERVVWGMVKLSEGGDVQPHAGDRVDALRSIGALVGGYAYEYAPREDQRAAAETFVRVLRAVGADDLYPAVDLESLCGVSGKVCVSPAVGLAHSEELADRIEQLLGVEVTVYTGRGFWGLLGAAGQASWLTRRRLWVADYNVREVAPWVPARDPDPCPPWLHPTAWQFRGDGLDRNLTSAAGLASMTWRGKVVEPSPDTSSGFAAVLRDMPLLEQANEGREQAKQAHDRRVSEDEDEGR